MTSGSRTPGPGAPASPQARLAAFLSAKTDDDAESCLAGIFDDAIERLLLESVRRALSGSARGRVDIEDVASETRVRLIRRLWTLRRERREPIEDFEAYVATTATRTCYAYLRARFPARTRLRNQVRYSVSRHPHARLEMTAEGVWQCRSRAIRNAPRAGSVRAFLDDAPGFIAQHRIDRTQPLAHLTAALLAAFDGPIELDRHSG